jgi:hypothetical protein
MQSCGCTQKCHRTCCLHLQGRSMKDYEVDGRCRIRPQSTEIWEHSCLHKWTTKNTVLKFCSSNTISLLWHDSVAQCQHTKKAVHIMVVPPNCSQQRRIIESKLRFEVLIPGEVQWWCILSRNKIALCT